MKICFVCLGNICRSPIAEVLFRKKSLEKGLKDWRIESRGTNRYHKGGPADERAVAVAKERGVDLSGHIARRFRGEDFREYNVLFVMADDVREEMNAFSSRKADFTRVRDFREDGQDVPDPWYGGVEDFRACYDLIEERCEVLIAELLRDQERSRSP